MALRQYLDTLGDSAEISKFVSSLQEKQQQRSKSLSELPGPSSKRTKLTGNQNALKDNRRYEVGWKNWREGKYKFVRETKGGGVRHLTDQKSTPLFIVKEKIINLYFPKGKSRAGHLEEFTVTLCDSAGEILDENITLIEQYLKMKQKMLRIYIHTIHSTQSPSPDSECTPATDRVDNELELRAGVELKQMARKEGDVHPTSTISVEDLIDIDELPDIVSLSHGTNRALRSRESVLKKKEPVPSTVLSPKQNIPLSREYSALDICCSPKATCPPDEPDLLQGSRVDAANKSPRPGCSSRSADACIESDLLQAAIDASLSDQYLLSQSDCEVFFGPSNDSGPLDDTIMPEDLMESSPDPQIIRLHRGHVFDDLNNIMKTECDINFGSGKTYEVEMILPNGILEKAQDNGGVLRDAISEYFDTFYKKCTLGNDSKIPMIRHDMKDVWVLVSKVILFAKIYANYFPIQLATPFLEYCLGIESSDTDIINAFMEVIPPDEKELVEMANQQLDDVKDSSEFLDFLESHEVKTVVSERTWKKILFEVSHRTIIQEPAYIAEQWSNVLKKVTLPSGGVKELRRELTPTTKNVVAALQFAEADQTSELAKIVKKFVRSLNAERIRKFVRFCTGAHILVCRSIQIRFVIPENENEILRNPVAHACGCLLEIPNTYSSYVEFAEEFNNVLDSDIWVMDIV